MKSSMENSLLWWAQQDCRLFTEARVSSARAMFGMVRTIPRCRAREVAWSRWFHECCKRQAFRIHRPDRCANLQFSAARQARRRCFSMLPADRPSAGPPDRSRFSNSADRSGWARISRTNFWGITTRTRRSASAASSTDCRNWQDETFTGADGTRPARLSVRQRMTLGPVVIRGTFNIGVIADTVIGPITLAGSVSPTGQSRVNFSIGRAF